jgi:uncharacterized Zn-binding protein involved in type VI secretion
MPAAARVGDQHVCQLVEPVPHLGGPILDAGCRTVFIGPVNLARVGDRALCAGDAHDVIVRGEPTVLVGGKPAARRGDETHGGHVTTGCRSVLIGPSPQAALLREAARRGLPFGEKRGRAR